MYIRVKRKKTTMFVLVEPTDTVLEVKQKLQELIQQVKGLPSCYLKSSGSTKAAPTENIALPFNLTLQQT